MLWRPCRDQAALLDDIGVRHEACGSIPRRPLHNTAAVGILRVPFIVLSHLPTACCGLVLRSVLCYTRSLTRSCTSGGGEDTLVLLLLLMILAIVGVFTLYHDDL